MAVAEEFNWPGSGVVTDAVMRFLDQSYEAGRADERERIAQAVESRIPEHQGTTDDSLHQAARIARSCTCRPTVEHLQVEHTAGCPFWISP